MIPITYAEALQLFKANGCRGFSFIVAPYMIQKTVMFQTSRRNRVIVAAPPNQWTREAGR